MKENICYFDESYIFFYTDYLDQNVTIEEAKFIKNELNPDSKILDVCCGHGRHTIELSKLGANIIGIDNSTEAIQLAKKKAIENNLNPNIFEEVDVFKFNTTDQFDCIILECNTLGLFAKKDIDLLIKIKSMLKDGGKIILDVLNKNFFTSHYQKQHWFTKGNNLVLNQYDYNDDKTAINVKEIRIINNIRKDYNCTLNLYTLDNLKNILTDLKLNIINVYADYKKSTFNNETSRNIVLTISK